jgi:transcriptional regulator with XRE-family HTH domain
LSNFYGGQIKKHRLRLKLTVERFAKMLGVSRATQMNYESGKTVPTLEYLDGCARLGINPLELLRVGQAANEKPSSSDELSVEIFRLFDSPELPLDTPRGRALLFQETLRLMRRVQLGKRADGIP